MVPAHACLAVAALVLGGGAADAAEPAKATVAPVVARIDVSFKMDPRLTRGLYLGDRWVSAQTFSISQPVVGATVEARAVSRSAAGRPVGAEPRWSAEDTEMIRVEPAGGKDVKIAVLRAGESRVRVSAGAVAREVTVRAVQKGEALLIEISHAGPAAAGAGDVGAAHQVAPGARALAEENRAEGEAFLAANAARDGVVTLASGLQYRVLKAGAGPRPDSDDTVVCHYRGTLLDGREFDSSYRRRTPARFAVGRVIRGWQEALQLMPTGSKWQLFVPPDLAYGEKGTRRSIGPHATLVFEVELLAIEDGSLAARHSP
jgi:FKBP-type peptidyl-prolyl cis-trans isomerase